MNKKDAQLLLAYNHWANAQILVAVSHLSIDLLTKDLSTAHHSVRETLTHILAAEWIWLMRCKGISPRAMFDPTDFPSLDSLKSKWAEVEQDQKGLIGELDDKSMGRVISYMNTKGERWEYPVGQILQHVVNHSSYHRGQVTAMLRQLGAESVMTDFLVYIDTKPAGV